MNTINRLNSCYLISCSTIIDLFLGIENSKNDSMVLLGKAKHTIDFADIDIVFRTRALFTLLGCLFSKFSKPVLLIATETVDTYKSICC